MAKRSRTLRYSVHPSVATARAILDSLPSKTGPALSDWVRWVPVHDALVEIGLTLGEDVKICPCQTIVPIYRNHVFAQIKPSTRTRIDFGLALKGASRKPPRRLVETGGLGKGDRITHHTPLQAPSEVDGQVRDWLQIAYDLDEGNE